MPRAISIAASSVSSHSAITLSPTALNIFIECFTVSSLISRFLMPKCPARWPASRQTPKTKYFSSVAAAAMDWEHARARAADKTPGRDPTPRNRRGSRTDPESCASIRGQPQARAPRCGPASAGTGNPPRSRRISRMVQIFSSVRQSLPRKRPLPGPFAQDTRRDGSFGHTIRFRSRARRRMAVREITCRCTHCWMLGVNSSVQNIPTAAEPCTVTSAWCLSV